MNINFRAGALTDVVNHNGNYYYIDSVDVPYSGCETAIFHCDAKGKVTDWREVYMERHIDQTEMEERHKYIVHHLRTVLDALGF